MALTLQEISEISHRDAQLAEALRKIQAAVNARAAVAGAAGAAGATGATGATGPAGLLSVVQLDKLGLTGNLVNTTLVTPASNGFYRIDVWIILTVAAVTSSTLPSSQLLYTDGDTGTLLSVNLTSIDAGNSVADVFQASSVFYAKAGTGISVNTASYASSPAGMKYNVRFRLEGPF